MYDFSVPISTWSDYWACNSLQRAKLDFFFFYFSWRSPWQRLFNSTPVFLWAQFIRRISKHFFPPKSLFLACPLGVMKSRVLRAVGEGDFYLICSESLEFLPGHLPSVGSPLSWELWAKASAAASISLFSALRNHDCWLRCKKQKNLAFSVCRWVKEQTKKKMGLASANLLVDVDSSASLPSLCIWCRKTFPSSFTNCL